MKTKRGFMNQEHFITEYDELVQTRELQLLKSLLPLANIHNQMPLAILIQSMQFRNTVRVFQNNADALSACSLNNEPDKRNAILQTLRKFCTPKERETIDTILNVMTVMENYDTFTS